MWYQSSQSCTKTVDHKNAVTRHHYLHLPTSRTGLLTQGLPSRTAPCYNTLRYQRAKL